MLALITLACLWLCETDYNQDGYNPPEGYETAQIAPGDDPTPLRVATASGSRFSPAVEEWRPLAAGHFGDLGVGAVDTVLCLMGFESGGLAAARNPSSGASGLMQILPSWADDFGVSKADLFRPEVNLFIARALYDEAESRGANGWGHWAPWLRGECR
jgi:hypothetical protein